MVSRIPSGTRDVLPDEMRELRAIGERLRSTFAAAGYGEVYTPALEYEDTLSRGGSPGGPAYRLFDEHGAVLVLRSDMTVPIARVAATRYASAEPPLRFCYAAHVYRGVRPQRGESRELLQAGVELIGAAAPAGTVEALGVLCDSLDSLGLRDYRVGLGDAALYPSLLDELGVDGPGRDQVLHELATRDFVGLERHVSALGLEPEATELLVRVPQTRGGPGVLEARGFPGPAGSALAEALGGLRAVHELLGADVAEHVILDLGLARTLGYYTGAVFEVYHPRLGAPLGGGGRYDDLLGCFGRPLPAVGFGLTVERLHIALTAQEVG